MGPDPTDLCPGSDERVVAGHPGNTLERVLPAHGGYPAGRGRGGRRELEEDPIKIDRRDIDARAAGDPGGDIGQVDRRGAPRELSDVTADPPVDLDDSRS